MVENVVVRFRSFSLRGRQDIIAADLATCAAMCDKVRGCHGYVYVEDVPANEEASRGLCSLKYGDVFVSGEHSQPRTVAQLSRYKYSTSLPTATTASTSTTTTEATTTTMGTMGFSPPDCQTDDCVILVSGGSGTEVSVELLDTNGTRLCSLPALPANRRGHAQAGLTVCGGHTSPVSTSCHTLASTGVWEESHTLVQERRWASVWRSPQGLMLLGRALNKPLRSWKLYNNG